MVSSQHRTNTGKRTQQRASERNGRCQKNESTGGNRPPAFLSHIFTPKPLLGVSDILDYPVFNIRENRYGRHDLEAAYTSLESSIQNYNNVFGCTIEIPPSELDIYIRLNVLYNNVREFFAKDKWEANIDIYKEELTFIVYKTTELNMSLYFIPTAFLPELKTESITLYKLACKFLYLVTQNFKIISWQESPHCWVFDEIDDRIQEYESYIDGGEDERDTVRYYKNAKALFIDGPAAKTIKEIYKHRKSLPELLTLERSLKRFTSTEASHKWLKDWILRGLSLMKEGKCLGQYDYWPDETDETVFDNLFALGWKNEDYFTDQIIDMLNAYANECGMTEPTQFFAITPDNAPEIKEDPFVSTFCKWVIEAPTELEKFYNV